MSYDEKTGAWTTSVVGVHIVHDGEAAPLHDFAVHTLRRITLGSDEGVGQEVIVTSNHGCFDPDRDTYRPAGEFVIGDSLRTPEGDVAVLAIEEVSTEAVFGDAVPVVYNLHMQQGPANYVAGGLLVHNDAK